MKFGTLVDLTEIIRMQKKFLKISIIFEVIFTPYFLQLKWVNLSCSCNDYL